MRTFPRLLACTSLLALLLASMGSSAWATSRKTKNAMSFDTGVAAASTTGTKKKPVKVKLARDETGESAAERSRRMERECRGLPNAGACRGYGYGS